MWWNFEERVKKLGADLIVVVKKIEKTIGKSSSCHSLEQ